MTILMEGYPCSGDLRHRRPLNPATPQFANGSAQEAMELEPVNKWGAALTLGLGRGGEGRGPKLCKLR